MSDEVGVEPERLAQLASALEELRDTLAANVPVIQNTLNGYWSGGTGAPVSLAPLQQALGKSVDDAASMRSRSNLAQAYVAHEVAVHAPAHRMAQIPWDTEDVDPADAQLQAQQLADGEEGGDPALVRSVDRDVADHKDDEQWLADFSADEEPALKSAERAEYRDGVRLAETLAQTQNYAEAGSLLAQRARDPYFTAGLLNHSSMTQIILILTSQPYDPSHPLPGSLKAIATAMGDGTLSSRTMNELVNWLAGMGANTGGNEFISYPLLQDIAQNRAASARLMACIDPTRQPGGPALMKAFLHIYSVNDGENSILQIMANDIYAMPSQQSAGPSRQSITLINSLVSDLSVLDSATLSQSGRGLSLFMTAAAVKLMPGISGPQQFATLLDVDKWCQNYGGYLDSLAPLLNEIGSAFENSAAHREYWRGFWEGLVMGVGIALLPVAPETLAGKAAAGAAEAAATAALQSKLDPEVSHLYPNGEDGGQAQQAYGQSLKMIVVLQGVLHIYTAIGDGPEAEQLLANKEFYEAVYNSVILGQGQSSNAYQHVLDQDVRLPGGETDSLYDIICNLSVNTPTGTMQ